MTQYSTDGWSDLFVAGAGAAAALTGLVFVALSINLQRILAGPGLSARAAGAIAVLTSALLICLAGLVPQPVDAFAIELLVAAVLGGTLAMRGFSRPSAGGGPTRAQTWGHVVQAMVPTVATALGGITLWAGAGGGLYWVAAGIGLLLLNGIGTAWVLLVEIQR